MGIRSYGKRAAKKFARGGFRRFSSETVPRIKALRGLLELGSSPAGLRADGYRSHRLTGNRKGYSAVNVSAALRGVFRFEAGNAIMWKWSIATVARRHPMNLVNGSVPAE